MAVCVVFTVDGGRVPFGRAAEETAVERVTLHPAVAAGGDVMVWAEADAARFEGALAAQEGIAAVALFVTLETGRLYRCEWLADGLYGAIESADGLLVDAWGSPARWTFRLWFPGETAASAFHEACMREEIEPEIERVRTVTDAEFRRYGLSDAQATLLRTAFDRGYFEVPRAVTLEELADGEEVSGQSVSARLRRAVGALVENALVNGGSGGSTPPRCWRPER